VFHRDAEAFNRKLRKLNSVLAGGASAKFSLLLGDVASFDCRICQLPRKKDLIDYLRWRNEDAHRNALNSHCHWTLRKKGAGVDEATRALSGLATGDKNDLLFREAGINFNDLPGWQKRGIGLYWEDYQKPGVDPRTGETVMATRRRIRVDLELPMRDECSRFVEEMIAREHGEEG
jgi:tRNA(His) 5'-end guanylyltransferase